MERNIRSRQRDISTLALKDKIKQVIQINDSPHKVALSFGVGVFIGMSPFFGIHTILGIAGAWIFNLNKFATIVGVYITNPLTIVPIYTFCTWVGAEILGIKQLIPDINWNEMSFYRLIHEMKPILMPFFFGTAFVGLISGVLSYIIIYTAMNRNRKRRRS